MDISSPLRDTIFENLKSGKWRVGDRLPTERELSATYKISRTTVRKLLQDMKDRGLITQTVGSGTYVSEHAAEAVRTLGKRDPGRQTSPAELMDARLSLEPAIIEMVIARATLADFDQMDICCANAEASTTVEEFEHWDGLLHEVIADSAHNSFISNVFKLMNQVRAQGEWGMLKKRSVTPERRLVYQNEHRLLVSAIKDRDQELAKALTLSHLLNVRKNLLNF